MVSINVSCHLSTDFLSYENTVAFLSPVLRGGEKMKVEFSPQQTYLTKGFEDSKPGYFLLCLAGPYPSVQNKKNPKKTKL